MTSSLARTLKATVFAPAEPFEPLSHHLWFHPMPNGAPRVVTHAQISAHADAEYDKFRRVDERVHHACNAGEQLRAWLQRVPEDELARLLDETPCGLAGADGYDFTPWQRLAMVVYSGLPYDVTSTITVDAEAIADIATRDAPAYMHDVRVTRKEPLHAQFSMHAGSFPEVGIVDLPTASGKTAWALAVASLAVADARYWNLVAQHRERRLHQIVQGLPFMPVARLVVVAATPATLDHFVSTLHRLVPNLAHPERVVVWTTVGKRTSVFLASQLPSDTVVFWVLPVSKLNSVLRAHPDVAVAVCITDEFIVDTPREKSRTMHSPVLKHLVAQATPEALVQATTGHRSFLQEAFGGALLPPKSIAGHVRDRRFTQAQRACEQACLLDLMTPLTAMRDFVRRDLAHLVPPALQVHFAKSRRLTMASLLQKSQADFVPASFANVLVAHMRPLLPSSEAIRDLHAFLADAPILDMNTLVQRLEAIPFTSTESNTARMRRLLDRLREFSASCPICLCEDRNDARLFGCCGYCACSACHARCSKCPFCRTEVPRAVPREDAMRDDDDRADNPLVEVVGSTLDETLRCHVSPQRSQVANVSVALQSLVHHGYRRTLVLIESSQHTSSEHFARASTRLHKACSVAGIQVSLVDHMLSGKGIKFAALLRAFSTETEQPMALAASLYPQTEHALLVGPDLAYVDSMVVVGNVNDESLVQAMGRVFRPRASRDNRKPVVMVKVYS